MDKRSWPWKKKSSDKQAAVKNATESSVASSDINPSEVDKVKQENNKKPKYVQLSMESYTHLTGLEDQVKSYEEQVKNCEEHAETLEDEIRTLNEKLSETTEEMTNKENLVKQHAKVAEEAVSGWEKAEAEAAALKNHLESVTLLKLTAEDRATHLDGALKECMRQIRNLKEENDQKLHELALNKTKLFDKMKSELEAKIAHLDQELLTSAAENAALARSLQERSNMLIQLNEDKSRAEAEIERLKSTIEACEREANSLKYELHIAKKEMEIRNEEKNMSVRAAEVANKQHLEGVKKIAKLEAECQRLRGLVKKKLPGPAALAQMKLEVENLGRDYGESRLKRSPAKPPTPHSPQLSEFSFENVHKYVKENEMLTGRLLAMEEETKMLKEALAKRNSELQATRSIHAQTASKLHSLEAQIQDNGEHRSPGSNIHDHSEGGFYDRKSRTQNFISMSEDGNFDNMSCSGSWAGGSMPELAHLRKDKIVDSPHMSENASHLDLMDDFLEMEKLAHQSNGNVSESEILNPKASTESTTASDHQSRDQNGADSQVPSKDDAVLENPRLHSLICSKLQSKISKVLELIADEKDFGQVFEDIRRLMQDMQDTLTHQSVGGVVEVANGSGKTSGINNTLDDSSMLTTEKAIPLSGDGDSSIDAAETVSKELELAISQIYDFLMILGKEAKVVSETTLDGDVLIKKLDVCSAKYGEAKDSNISLPDFILDVSHVLSKASQLHFSVLGFKDSESESVSSDCIDKIALPENKGVVNLSGERYPNGCSHFSDSASDPDVPNDGNPVPTSESSANSWKCSLEEFEQLKMEKENLAVDLGRISENFENAKSQLLETERVLAEVKSQLASTQKSNSFVETQLKCMTESYKSLEKRAEELEIEVNMLRAKIESLEIELREERINHEEALNRCKDLQVQLERIESSEAVGNDDKTSQEKELAAAAEKLAECQETIYLLGKQLKAFRPQTESPDNNSKARRAKSSFDDEVTISSGSSLHETDHLETDTATSVQFQRVGSESPMHMDLFNSPFSPPHSEVSNLLKSPGHAMYPKHHPTKSGSSSNSSTPTPEKQARGFSRFFSTKGKNGL